MPITLMTPGGCVDAVAALLAALPGITGGLGKVYKRRRIVRNEADVKAILAGTGGKVNAWMVYPSAAGTTVTQRNPGFKGIGQKGGAEGNVNTTMQFSVDVYYQIDDVNGSEETFRDLVWAAVTEMNSYGTLPIPGIVFQVPTDVEQFGFIALAGAGLYHYARISCGFMGRTH
jgi:hypothetical protein